MNDLKCTIITVSYNSESTIERTIKSVFNQNYDNIEYIIVDAASTDGTVDIIKKYEPLFEGKLKWVSEPDEGIYYGMNKGIEMATGDIIGIINSDDEYACEAVEKVCELFGEEQYQIIYGAMDVFEGKRYIRTSFVSHDKLPKEPINHPSVFVSRSIYEDFGKYNVRYRYVADFEFLARVSKHKDICFKSTPDVLAMFYKGGISQSDKAYMDLLKYKKDIGDISVMRYWYHIVLYKLIMIKRRQK